MKIIVDNINFSNLDKRISHLTNEQIVNLMERYYEGEKVSKILEEYKIRINVSQLYSIFPPIITNDTCIHCNSDMLKSWSSKSRATLTNEDTSYCINCNHKNSKYCNCDYCEIDKHKKIQEQQESQKELVERKKVAISEFYDESNWTLELERELTLEDRLYLAVLLRSSLSENTLYIEALEPLKNTLAPTKEFEVEIIKTLTSRKIIVPHALSDIDAFEIENADKNDFQIMYGIYKVRYRINVEPEDLDYNAMIKRLLYPDFNNEDTFQVFCYEMWKKLALSECLNYLLYQMKKVGYSFNPGDKTIRVFENLLEHFSISQIYGIIYSAVAKSTQRYQAKEITKIHAQNSVISSCENYGQRALAQGWILANYSRIKDLPETYISFILFTSIMQIDELGFSEKPTPNF